MPEDDQPISDAIDFQIVESRRVIDQQIETVREMDQKAVWTVRIGVIFLGIVLSAVQISGGQNVLNILTITGGIAVSTSIVVGLYAYTTTDPYFGSGPLHVERFLTNRPQEIEWKLKILRGYRHWLQYNREVTIDDAKWLLYAQVLLAIGILSTVVGLTFAL